MRSIDPVHSLAFSIQANPGVYAVLVGSGVSRAAKIPTGWEITLDLTRKLAKLHGEESDPNPEQWYLKKFDKEPSYSASLDELTRTQAERQQLLRGYFEPTDEERQEGDKAPTAAHRAIAALAARTYVRVIITTNFDRLVETALTDEGVVPTIFSSPDQVQGALPLIHTQCCVFKVNGDYLDTRILNTPAELDEYPKEFNELLDRIFDEFGLIVCGWSAEWDGALRKALFRASSRRFTTYWASRGEPGEKAQRLIDHRKAELIAIEDADSFFSAVQQNVASIEEFSRPHPLSTEVAVASLKRYISDPQHRIRLSDLVDETVGRVVDVITAKSFIRYDLVNPTPESTTAQVHRYESACSTLVAMATVGGFWAESDHFHVWQRALQRLGSLQATAPHLIWNALKKYPVTLLLYALGLGAVESQRLEFLRHMFDITVPKGLFSQRGNLSATQVFLPYCWGSDLPKYGGDPINILDEMYKRKLMSNEWIHEAIRPHSEHIIHDNSRYALVFDRLEILMALNYAYKVDRPPERYWAPSGGFAHRIDNRDEVFKEIEESLSSMQEKSPFVTSGIFGETVEKCEKEVTDLRDFLPTVGWQR